MEICFNLFGSEPESNLRIRNSLAASIWFGIMEKGWRTGSVPFLSLDKEDGGSIHLKLNRDGKPEYEFKDKHGKLVFGNKF